MVSTLNLHSKPNSSKVITITHADSSFISRALLSSLLASNPNPTIRTVPGQILNPSELRSTIGGSDTVFHVDPTLGTGGGGCLAPGDKGWYEKYKMVVEGTRDVVRVCLECGVKRLVYCGSADVVFDGVRDVVNGNEDLEYPDKVRDVVHQIHFSLQKHTLQIDEKFKKYGGKNNFKPNPMRISKFHTAQSITITDFPPPASKMHANLLKKGIKLDVFSWNKIIIGYARCSNGIVDATKVFDEMSYHDTASWNSLIASFVINRYYTEAWNVLKTILQKRLNFNQYTFGSLLKSVANVGCVDFGNQLHTLILKSGLDQNVFVGSALLDMYAKCGNIMDAYSVFTLMPNHNIVSWNAVIAGFCQIGEVESVFSIFKQMEMGRLKPDEATFASILTLVDEAICNKLTIQLHSKILKYGQDVNTIVCNAVITAYSQCGMINDCTKVFDDMYGVRDLVTWNSILAAYAFHGCTEKAIELFIRMLKLRDDQDMFTLTSVISCCFDHGHVLHGKVLHSLVVKNGLDQAIAVSNALIAMYIRCSENCSMDDALKCFHLMKFKDKVSWNSILTGLSQNWYSDYALKLFVYMRYVCQEVDHYAFSATLQACSDLAVVQFGRAVHSLLFKFGHDTNEFVLSALIYMYSKCGIIIDARKSFEDSRKGTSVTWNSILFGYATHGQGKTALDLFHKMQELEVKPDHITFLALLSACSHIGLVEEGSKLLKSMEPKYGIPLRMEHYACGVDIYGRAGKLDEAINLIKSMPYEPGAMVWITLLGACRIHGNFELASHVGQHLLKLEPKHHSAYVILSHMYSGVGMKDHGAMLQRVMKSKGLSKVPGWSWIEVNNNVHSFNAEDRSHIQSEEIYEMIRMLFKLMEAIVHEDFHLDMGLADTG